MNVRHLLVADIGGTNSRFAMFALEEAPGGLELYMVPGSRVSLRTGDFSSFEGLLESLREVVAPGGFSLLEGGPDYGGFNIAAASLAVPGAIHGEGAAAVCQPPNISWPLSAAEAIKVVAAPVFLLNDFAAQGMSCLFPEVLEPRPVVPGTPVKTAPSVIIGAGTGLGKAIILPDAREVGAGSAFAGGMAESATGSAPDVAAPRRVFVPLPGGQQSSRTDVVFSGGRDGTLSEVPGQRAGQGAIQGSGQGSGEPSGNHSGTDSGNRAFRRLGLSARVLPTEGGHSVFPFKGPEEAAFERFITGLTGRHEVIGDMAVTGFGLAALYAFHNGDNFLMPPPEVTPLLEKQPKALEWMARFYGRACRNMVFETLALGGVYLSGGMISHVPGLLGHPAFTQEFLASESQPQLIAKVPVWVVGNPDNGLWGAALYALDQCRA